MDNNSPVARLIAAQQQVVSRAISSATHDWMDLGRITKKLALQLDNYSVPFPIGHYLVLRGLTFKPRVVMATTQPTIVTGGPHGHPEAGGTPSHDHTPHVHTVENTEYFHWLTPGDRVLVAWVNGATDPVVIGVVERTSSYGLGEINFDATVHPPSEGGTFNALRLHGVEIPGTGALSPVGMAQIPSPNYWADRPYLPLAIVIHTMSGTLASTASWFSDPASLVSSHFGVGLQGEVHQYVDLSASSWANGIPDGFEEGSLWAATFGSAESPNRLSITIETEDADPPTYDPTEGGNGLFAPVSDEQYDATLNVCRYILAQYPSISHLFGHCGISPVSRPNCPGDRWVDSGRFTDLATALNLEPVTCGL